jgi:predicted nucleic acid-binding protein
MFVLDASVLANAVGDAGDDGQRARTTLRDAEVISVPAIAEIETVSVLRRRWQRGDLDLERFSGAVDDLASLPMTRFPSRPFLRRAFELRDNLTPYDALYVALAEALECPLYTADKRLSNAPGPRCEIRLVA